MLVQDLFGQIIHQVVRIAFNAGEQGVRVGMVAHGNSSHLQSCYPAIRPFAERCDGFRRQVKPHHLLAKLGHLFAGETQVVHAQGHYHPLCHHRGDIQLRHHPAGNDQMQILRDMQQEEINTFKDGRVFDVLKVIQDQRHFLLFFSDFVNQQGKADFNAAGFCGLEEIEGLFAYAGIDILKSADQILVEPARIVVFGIHGEPGDREVNGPGPFDQQVGFPESDRNR